MTKSHGGGIIGGGIIGGAITDNRSLRRNHWKENHREEIIEERGRHLAGIWEASGRHLGGIWDSRSPCRSMRLQNHKNRYPSQLECKTCIKIAILLCVFEGGITKHWKLQALEITS